MKIKWLGHSAFLLEESTGTKVVTDPFDENVVGYAMTAVDADIVTVSHNHEDHANLNALNDVKDATIIKTAGAYEIDGVHIIGINSYHDEVNGAKRGKNTIFKYRIDGVDVCHLGDIGEECSIKLAEAIGSVNVLMIPIGGNYTIDAEQAKEYVDFLMPDIVIPMHYKCNGCNMDIDKADKFLKLFEDENIYEYDTDIIELDRTVFEGDETKIVVLNR